MKFQVMSNFHISGKPVPKPECTSDVLVLAGNIGHARTLEYNEFLKYCSETWKHVVMILGEYEFCADMTAEHTWKLHRQVVSKYDNVHLLENSSVVIDGVRFFGSTFWYFPTIGEYDSDAPIIGFPFLNATIREMRYRSGTALKQSMRTADDVVIVTFYPPTQKSPDVFVRDTCNKMLSYRNRSCRPRKWIFGKSRQYTEIDDEGMASPLLRF